MSAQGYRQLKIPTARGDVLCRLYEPNGGSDRAVVMVGGAGGGFATPARGLYRRLCEDLRREGMTALRVRFRDPQDLEQATFDLGAGVAHLQDAGASAIGLVGHSFGGAVVLRAAIAMPAVTAVVALAAQSYGVPAHLLRPGTATLFLHGADDTMLPPSTSLFLYRTAPQPADLTIYPGADHELDEVADDVYRRTRDWIERYIQPEASEDAAALG